MNHKLVNTHDLLGREDKGPHCDTATRTLILRYDTYICPNSKPMRTHTQKELIHGGSSRVVECTDIVFATGRDDGFTLRHRDSSFDLEVRYTYLGEP